MSSKCHLLPATIAAVCACATDEDLPSGPNEPMRLWFAVVKAIDRKLAQFAHAQQTEGFKPRGLSFEAVEAKLCAAVKTKEFNGRAHEQQTLATRKFVFGGAERELRIIDAASMMPTNAPVEHQHRSVCAFAVRLESVYAGVGRSKHGCTWAIDEVCLVSGGRCARRQPSRQSTGARSRYRCGRSREGAGGGTPRAPTN
jgi:hypothetical protein